MKELLAERTELHEKINVMREKINKRKAFPEASNDMPDQKQMKQNDIIAESARMAGIQGSHMEAIANSNYIFHNGINQITLKSVVHIIKWTNFISVECPPTKDVGAKQAFDEMTESAGQAHDAEIEAETNAEQVQNKANELLAAVGDRVELTQEGINEYIELVNQALKSAKESKAKNMGFGMTCLNLIGLCNRLPLANFEKKVSSRKQVKCKFCDKKYKKFVIMSEHMLRAHAKELGIDVSVEDNAESSEHEQVRKVKSYTCGKCKKVFNNLPACTSHENICSGDPDRPKCAKCGKVFGTKNSYKKHNPCN